MPFTINGFGTHYWGKSNLLVTHGRCESCGQETKLETYDTVNYVTAVFFPLFPLGKKRVMWDCAACRKHRVMSHKKWREAVDEAVRSLTGDTERKEESEGVRELLGTLVGLQASEAFAKVMGVLEKRTWRNVETLEMISEAYLHFNYVDPALDFALKAYRKRPGPETGRQVVILYALKGETGPIAPMLDEALRESKPNIPLLTAGIEGLVANRENETALRYLERVQALRLDSESKQHVADLAEMARHPSKSPARNLRKAYKPPKPVKHGTSFGTHFARWAFPAVAVPALLFWLTPWLDPTPEVTISVVNGLTEPYEIVLNGERHRLRPRSRRRVTLPDTDTLVWKDADPLSPPEIAPGRQELNVGAGGRVPRNHVFILNPDRVALLHHQRVEYRSAETMDLARQGTSRIFVGKAYYDMDNVDYPFRPLPEELDLYASDARWVTSLELIREYDPAMAFTGIESERGAETARSWLARLLAYDPTNPALLGWASGVLDRDTLGRVLKTTLAAYPLEIEAHRLMQSVRQRAGELAELEADYRKRMEKYPEDADALYLYGRILEDENEASRYFRRAAEELDPPSAYALYALAYADLNRGNPVAAREKIERALSLDPDNPTFRSRHVDLLWATRDADRLLPLLNEAVADSPDSFPAYEMNIVAHAAFGFMEKAEIRMKALRRRMTRPDSGMATGDVQSLMRLLAYRAAYASPGFDPAAFSVRPEDPEYTDFMIQATDGKYEFCRKYVEGLEEEPDPHFHAVLHLLARRRGNPAAADVHFTDFISLLQMPEMKAAKVLEWMRDELPPTPEEVIELNAPPELKKYYVAMLCEKFPGLREPLRELRGALNYMPTFPFRLLKI